jgi:hypothetical protein
MFTENKLSELMFTEHKFTENKFTETGHCYSIYQAWIHPIYIQSLENAYSLTKTDINRPANGQPACHAADAFHAAKSGKLWPLTSENTSTLVFP